MPNSQIHLDTPQQQVYLRVLNTWERMTRITWLSKNHGTWHLDRSSKCPWTCLLCSWRAIPYLYSQLWWWECSLSDLSKHCSLCSKVSHNFHNFSYFPIFRGNEWSQRKVWRDFFYENFVSYKKVYWHFLVESFVLGISA